MYWCGRSLVVKPQPSKLMMRVRFPPPACLKYVCPPRLIGALTRLGLVQSSRLFVYSLATITTRLLASKGTPEGVQGSG